MMQHPGMELKQLLKERGRTQKSFALLIGKRTSEVNELIKGKRNITIPRDYLLYKYCQTERGYRIQKQLLFDYEQFIQELPPEERKIEEKSLQEQFQQQEQQQELKKKQEKIQIFLDF